MNFRNEVSSCATRMIEAAVWINEIESAKSNVADKRRGFDSKMKIINGDFKKRDFIEEEAARKAKRFPTGRQVAWMIYEHQVWMIFWRLN